MELVLKYILHRQTILLRQMKLTQGGLPAGPGEHGILVPNSKMQMPRLLRRTMQIYRGEGCLQDLVSMESLY